MIPLPLLGTLASLAGDALKRVLPAEKMSESERLQVEKELKIALMEADDKRMETQLSAIISEAKSGDKWTSRARPSFLYVMYVLILFAIPYGVVYIFAPAAALDLAEGMKAWLHAIPDMLWGVFGAGYLGYVGGRTFEKIKKPSKKETW